MKLYHYTAISLGEAIFSSDISHGHLMHGDGHMTHNVVWLTTDPQPDGHGLTLGKELLTESQRQHMQRVQHGPLRNSRTLDKTQLRFTVELNPDQLPGLMSFISYCENNESETFAKVYGLSCVIDMKATSDKELKRLMQSAPTKERTWWLSFRPVMTRALSGVEFNVDGKFEPYDFERHGREAMRQLGFTYPSPAALSEVAEIVQPVNAFERPKAFVFCENPSKPAKVAIRGGGTERAFELQTGAPFVGAEDDRTRPLQDWVRRHRDELEACSSEAVELYYSYYPERRTSTAA